jgi:hypothetical protein
MLQYLESVFELYVILSNISTFISSYNKSNLYNDIVSRNLELQYNRIGPKFFFQNNADANCEEISTKFISLFF